MLAEPLLTHGFGGIASHLVTSILTQIGTHRKPHLTTHFGVATEWLRFVTLYTPAGN
jgi:hypothetical protein